MYYSRPTLVLTTMLCAACADNRNQPPNDPSQVDQSIEQNAAAASPEASVVEGEHRHDGHRPIDQATNVQATPEPGIPNPQQQAHAPMSAVGPESSEQARAAFTSANGYDVRGQAEFTELARGVEVRVAVNGAPPGVKGVHIHQKADCSDIPNKSMGAHFSPDGQEHGYPADQAHHLGDLGNIQIGADGAGELKVVVPAANLKDADSHSFLTRSIVVHEASDKGTGEAGEAGKPIACGIIDR